MINLLLLLLLLPPNEIRISLLPLHVPVLMEVTLQGLHILFKAERGHGPHKIIAVDGLPLLVLALIRGLCCDEADEL